MKLTVTAINKDLGFYRVSGLKRRTLAAFVLPSFKVALGLTPNREDVIDSVRQLYPDLLIPEDVAIQFDLTA